MATAQELKEALKDTLDRNGSLKKVKAKIRADVFLALQDNQITTVPEPSNHTLLINELIREYLIFNGYRETASVFVPESGQPEVRPFERSFLAEHLGLQQGPNSKQLPLLYSLVEEAEHDKHVKK